MKVLLVTHRFPPDGVAGVERISQDLASVLARRGESVTVVTRQWSRWARLMRRWKHEVTPDGVRVERLPGVPPPLDRASAPQDASVRAFKRVFDAAAPDVVHVMHAYGFSPGCLEAVLERRVPLIVSLQDFFFACPLVHLRKNDGRLCAGPNEGVECATTCFRGDPQGHTRWALRASYFRALMNAATEVIAPTEYVATYFAEEGIAERPVRVIANPIEPERAVATRPLRRADRLRLAYIGAVAPIKGVDLILQALASTDPPTRPSSLLIAGAEPDRRYSNHVRALARELGGVDVRFAGAYERAQLGRLLADVDVVVVPSRVPESFSMTVREAQALGRPVIAARIGALADAVEDGVTGWSFTPDSADSLAQVLDRLSADVQHVERAREAVSRLSFLSPESHAAKVLDVYRSALSARRPACDDDVGVTALGSALAAIG